MWRPIENGPGKLGNPVNSAEVLQSAESFGWALTRLAIIEVETHGRNGHDEHHITAPPDQGANRQRIAVSDSVITVQSV